MKVWEGRKRIHDGQGDRRSWGGGGVYGSISWWPIEVEYSTSCLYPGHSQADPLILLHLVKIKGTGNTDVLECSKGFIVASWKWFKIITVWIECCQVIENRKNLWMQRITDPTSYFKTTSKCLCISSFLCRENQINTWEEIGYSALYAVLSGSVVMKTWRIFRLPSILCGTQLQI
jgi:hypothetical protein